MRLARPVLAGLCPLALTMILLPGCGGSPQPTSPDDGAPGSRRDTPASEVGPTTSGPKMADAVEILAKVTGDQLPISDPMLGRVNESALSQLGLAERFAEEGFTLEPSQHTVILLSLGEQSSGGFSADITDLQLKGNELFVQGVAVAPAENSVNTQAITYPFAAVAIEKVPSGVQIRSDIKSQRQ